MAPHPWVSRLTYSTQLLEILDRPPQEFASDLPMSWVFYGPAGIGKTGLCHSLRQDLGSRYTWGMIDGADLSQRPAMGLAQLLIRWRRQLNSACSDFIDFDLAFCHYRLQTQPHPPQTPEALAETWGWQLSDTAKVLIRSLLITPNPLTLPPTTSLAKLGWFVINSGAPRHWQWYHHTPCRDHLHHLAEQRQDREILQESLAIFLRNLQDHLQRQGRRGVICVDDADHLLADAQGAYWLSQLMEQAPPELVWVLFAQGPLEQIPAERQSELQPLTPEESRALVQAWGIAEGLADDLDDLDVASVVAAVERQGQAGIPRALRLALACWRGHPGDLDQRLALALEDPAQALNPQLRESLGILSWGVDWDRGMAGQVLSALDLNPDLGSLLTPEGSPLPGAGLELTDWGHFRVESIWRRSVQESLSQGQIWRVHQVLFEIYQSRFVQTGALQDLEQGLIQGRQGLEPEQAVAWVVEQSPQGVEQGWAQGMVVLLADLWQGEQGTGEQAKIGLRLGQALCAMQEWDWGIGVLEQVDQVWSELEVETGPEAAETALRLGEAYLSELRTWEAYRVLRRALQIRMAQAGEGSVGVAEVLSRLAEAAIQQPNIKEALNWSVKALDHLQRDPQVPTTDIAQHLETIGYLYYQLDDLPAAIRAYQQGLDRLDTEAVGLQISIMVQMAVTYEGMKDHQQALRYHKWALDLASGVLEPGHPQVVVLLKAASRICRKLGLEERAYRFEIRWLRERGLWRYYEETVEGSQQVFRLGRALLDNGHLEQAEPLLIAAVELRERLLDPGTPQVADSYNSLAVLYQRQGRYQEAEPLFQQALASLRRQFSDSDPRIISVTSNLADLYHENLDRHEEAASLYQQALDNARPSYPTDHPHVQHLEQVLATIGSLLNQTQG